MRRVIASLSVLLVVLAGCGGPRDEAGSSTTPTSGSSPTTSPAHSGVPEEPGPTAVPAESDRPAHGGGGGSSGGGGSGGGASGDGASGSGSGDDAKANGGTGEDDRVIELGGPTLDNTYPTNPFALPDVGRSSCVVFTNRKADVMVTVRGVRLIDQQPSAAPGLALGDNPSQHAQCRAEDNGAVPHEVEKLHDTCTDAVLEPEQRTGCPVEVRSVGTVGTDYTALLVLRLSATCTSLSGEPCARLVGHSRPTDSHPVTVSWTDTRRYCSCLVPRDRGGAEFLPDEGDGRCPVDSTSGSPSEASPSQRKPPPSQEPGAGEGQPSTQGDDASKSGQTSEPLPDTSADDG